MTKNEVLGILTAIELMIEQTEKLAIQKPADFCLDRLKDFVIDQINYVDDTEANWYEDWWSWVQFGRF